MYGEHVACSNVWIEHGGHRVSVGSGFTSEQRLRFAAHPDEIVSARVRGVAHATIDREADHGGVLCRVSRERKRTGVVALPARQDCMGRGQAQCVGEGDEIVCPLLDGKTSSARRSRRSSSPEGRRRPSDDVPQSRLIACATPPGPAANATHRGRPTQGRWQAVYA